MDLDDFKHSPQQYCLHTMFRKKPLLAHTTSKNINQFKNVRPVQHKAGQKRAKHSCKKFNDHCLTDRYGIVGFNVPLDTI